jgi:hypothetical protein
MLAEQGHCFSERRNAQAIVPKKFARKNTSRIVVVIDPVAFFETESLS